MEAIVQKLLFDDSKIFVSQGAISGGCATHAAAGALAALGIIADPGRLSASQAEPNTRRLWAALQDTYAQGISLCDLVQRIDGLQFPLKLEHVDSSHHRVLRYAVESLQRRCPVILSFAPLNRPTRLHAVLGIGLSGQMDGRRFIPSALLITDSFEEHPGVGPVNARLQFLPTAKRERSGLYVTAWAKYRVSLAGAIALRRREGRLANRLSGTGRSEKLKN